MPQGDPFNCIIPVLTTEKEPAKVPTVSTTTAPTPLMSCSQPWYRRLAHEICAVFQNGIALAAALARQIYWRICRLTVYRSLERTYLQLGESLAQANIGPPDWIDQWVRAERQIACARELQQTDRAAEKARRETLLRLANHVVHSGSIPQLGNSKLNGEFEERQRQLQKIATELTESAKILTQWPRPKIARTGMALLPIVPAFWLLMIDTRAPQQPIPAPQVEVVSSQPSVPAIPVINIINSSTDEQSIKQAIAHVICGFKVQLHDGSEYELPVVGGSGFQINDGGDVLTNKHVLTVFTQPKLRTSLLKERGDVIQSAEPRVWVFFGQTRLPATVAYESQKFDMAVLKTHRSGGAVFPLSSTPTIRRGQKVYALGFPGVTQDALSDEERVLRNFRNTQLHTRIEKYYLERDFEYVQTCGTVGRVAEHLEGIMYVLHDASIHAGNSGGPLITEDGVVVGINTFRHRQAESVNYALSMAQLRTELQQNNVKTEWK